MLPPAKRYYRRTDLLPRDPSPNLMEKVKAASLLTARKEERKEILPEPMMENRRMKILVPLIPAAKSPEQRTVKQGEMIQVPEVLAENSPEKQGKKI